ncbi:MAG: CAP domain-containing protein [Pirellulales bacterium]|nr:CAP domain-containing protein [Pirellulales bacterium]
MHGLHLRAVGRQCGVAAGLAVCWWASVAKGLEVDPSSRAAARAFYISAYLPSEGVDIGWTGNHAACDAGTTSPAYQQAELDRINYFRAMAGVPAEVSLNAQWSAMDQQAALMMSANTDIDHSPPATWMCYTSDGALAASKSNLALGVSGPTAINFYMQDGGGPNYAAGHRRLLLYPPVDEMGVGDVPRASPYLPANALWVKDDTLVMPRPATRDPYVAWPPAGFVPYQVTYSRWSFSYPGANFSNAMVAMSENGTTIPATLEPLAGGFGDNTLVWRPKNLSDTANWPRPAADTRYEVTLSNVVIGGTARMFSYDVTVFDPAQLLADFNGDQLVNGADLAAWEDHFGSNFASPADGDADRDGDVDGGDLLIWQGEASAAANAASAASIPEPASAALLLLGVGLCRIARLGSRVRPD